MLSTRAVARAIVLVGVGERPRALPGRPVLPYETIMYRPDHFRVEDIPEMHALMRARPFATLVSSTACGLVATHLPTVLRQEGEFGVIECPLARPNPHWKD